MPRPKKKKPKPEPKRPAPKFTVVSSGPTPHGIAALSKLLLHIAEQMQKKKLTSVK